MWPSPAATASFASATCSLVLVSRFVPRPIRGTSVSPGHSFGASSPNRLRSLLRPRAVLRLAATGIPVGERQAGGATAHRLRARERVDDGHELALAVSAPSRAENIAHRIRDVFTARAQPSWQLVGLPRCRLSGITRGGRCEGVSSGTTKRADGRLQGPTTATLSTGSSRARRRDRRAARARAPSASYTRSGSDLLVRFLSGRLAGFSLRR
jgi:hypothetical protein